MLPNMVPFCASAGTSEDDYYMAQKTQLWWTFTCISAGMGTVVALISTTNLARWSVVALVLLGATLLSVSFLRLGWHRAPHPLGTPVRTAVLLFGIWAGMIWLGSVAHIEPEPIPPARPSAPTGLRGGVFAGNFMRYNEGKITITAKPANPCVKSKKSYGLRSPPQWQHRTYPDYVFFPYKPHNIVLPKLQPYAPALLSFDFNSPYVVTRVRNADYIVPTT